MLSYHIPSYFFHDYSSVLDNHSVLQVITVILSSTFIAAHMEHIQRPGGKENPPGLQIYQGT